MNQYKVILNTCPQDELLEHNYDNFEVPVLDSELNNRITCKSNPLWSKTVHLIDQILGIENKITTLILKSRGAVPCTEFNLVNPSFIPVADKLAIENNLTEIFNKIVELKNSFGNIPLTNNLFWLEDEINNALSESHSEVIHQSALGEFSKKTEKLIEKMLVVMQNIYKKYFPVERLEERVTPAEIKSEEVENQLLDGHLNTLLLEKLASDIDVLEMPLILKKVHKLTTLLVRSHPDTVVQLKPLVNQFLPFLEQIVQIYQYFMTQQVSAYRVSCKMSSILLNIFIELASKVSISCIHAYAL